MENVLCFYANEIKIVQLLIKTKRFVNQMSDKLNPRKSGVIYIGYNQSLSGICCELTNEEK